MEEEAEDDDEEQGQRQKESRRRRSEPRQTEPRGVLVVVAFDIHPVGNRFLPDSITHLSNGWCGSRPKSPDDINKVQEHLSTCFGIHWQCSCSLLALIQPQDH